MIEYSEVSLDSKVLGRELLYRVLVPETQAAGSESLPILYLLHGLFGDRTNWQELTRISALESVKSMAVVMPDAGDSWYVDGPKGSCDDYETFFLEEFLPVTGMRLRSNGKRAVAGLSMGGYGALKFALKRPDLFAFAASSSGAFNVTRLTSDDCQGDLSELENSVSAVFGSGKSECRIANDLFLLAESADPSALPPIHIECGTEDVFLESNRRFVEVMSSRSISHSYSEISGGHDWNFWAESFERIVGMALGHLSAC